MKLTIFAFILTLLHSAFAFAQSDVNCSQFIKNLPHDFTTIQVQVPEDWSQPEGKKIIVAAHFRLGNQMSTPIIFFNGGPGFASWLNFSDSVMLEQIRSRNLSFVFIDQRGTGCSSKYPKVIDPNSLANLRFYGSRAIVHDAEYIRKFLFSETSKWTIFGQSYGAFIVHRYITLFPNSIRAAHAHGMALNDNPLGPYYYRVLGQRRISRLIARENPDFIKVVRKIEPYFDSNRCFRKNGLEICGRGVLDGILVSVLASYYSWPKAEKILENLIVNSAFNQRYAEELVERFIFFLYARDDVNFTHNQNPFSLWTGPAFIGVMELNASAYDPEDPQFCNRINAQIKREYADHDSVILNECRFVLALKLERNLNKSTKGDVANSEFNFRDPLTLEHFSTRLGQINLPFFLYSGERDTFVPKELFDSELKHLGDKINYQNFPNSGHDGYSIENSIWEHFN